MHSDFWLERWQNGVIGFHLSEVNRNLVRFWPSLNVPPPAKVLVPLCGKSLDMHWLGGQGYQVLGVELSELAVKSFFAEAGLQPTHGERGSMQSWQAGNIQILCGDFFDLTADDVAGCNLIYDRAALIALPQDLRRRYVEHLRRLFSSRPTQGLLVVLDYPQQELPGPPFSVGQEEIAALYRGAEVCLLQQTDVLAQEPRFRNQGVSSLFESVYALAWDGESGG